MKDESEEQLAVDLSLVSVHMLTCPARAASCAATLARWDATDWGKLCGRPRVHVDDAPETPEAPWGDAQRGARIVAAFAKMLATAADDPHFASRQQATHAHGPGGWLWGDAYVDHQIYKMEREGWILLLEDDLDFHPKIGAAVASWDGAREGVMRSLFNPGLSPAPASSFIVPPRSFHADPATFLGAQALFVCAWFARYAAEHWHTVTGMQSQRLARLHEQIRPGLPILVHRPSLVQHLPVAGGSGWGARVQQALDFDPSWRPPG